MICYDIDEDESGDNGRGGAGKKKDSSRFMPPHTLTAEPFWSFAKVKHLAPREVSDVMKVTQLGSEHDSSSSSSLSSSSSSSSSSGFTASSSIAIGTPFVRTSVAARSASRGPSLLSQSLR